MKTTPFLLISSVLLAASVNAHVVILHDFSGGFGDGRNPVGSLTYFNDQLFGMTRYGGTHDGGTIISINPDGSGYTKLHDFGTAFTFSNGSVPQGNLAVSGSALYGITNVGGNGDGVVFSINPNGSNFTIRRRFDAGIQGRNDGRLPQGSLVLNNGSLFGLTTRGGANDQGTALKIDPNGSNYDSFHTFAAGADNGRRPHGSLTSAGNTLFGMTREGGASDRGVIFSVDNTGNNFNVVHTFSDAAGNGALPEGSLVHDNDTLYGMTTGASGTFSSGTVFRVKDDGSDFEVLHSFIPAANGGGDNGSNPRGDLLLHAGKLYGLTQQGGDDNRGIVFQLETDGSGFTILHEFTGINGDGSQPWGSLTAVGDTLYGMTDLGGDHNRGTIFSIAIPEPTTSAGLLGLGALALVGLRRRRR